MVRTSRLLFALAAAAAVLVPLPGQAISRLYLPTRNASDHKAWITIQNDIKTRNLDSGWVPAGGFREWYAGTYLTGSYYYVRFEFVDKDDKVVCDTKARLFADYTNGNRTETVLGYYKDGHCYIKAFDKVFPY